MIGFKSALGIVLSGALVGGAASAQDEAPGLLLDNANVVTMAGNADRTEAIAISGNRIVAVGEGGELLGMLGDDAPRIDLQGATVIPGLIDNHVHYVRAAGGDPGRFAAIVRDLNAAGVTSVLDAGGFNFTDDLLDPVRDLDRRGELDLRVFHTKWLPARSRDAALRARDAFAPPNQKGGGLVQFAGIGETLYRPLHDNPSRPFSPTPGQTETAAALLEGLVENQLHLHTRTEAATAFYLGLFEQSAPGAARRLGWTLHHLENATLETIRRIADVGALAAVHPRGARTTSIDGRSSLRPPVGLFEREGVVWGLGTDATGNGQALLGLAAWAVGEGSPADTANTIGPEAALRALTLNNARLLGRSSDLGSIEAGKLADLVVLDRDVTDPAQRFTDARVLMTIVDGRIVYRVGE